MDIFYLVLFIICLFLAADNYILTIIGDWRIFKKAGEKGWKSLIPIYSLFVEHRVIGMRHIWLILDLCAIATEFVLDLFEDGFDENVKFVVAVIIAVITFIGLVLRVHHLGNCFGKGTGFKIGLFFIPGLFSLILGFGSAKYTKPEKH